MKYNNTVCVCMYKVPRSYKISVYINAGIHYVLIYTFNVILGKCWCHSALACWTKGRNRRDDKSCRWKGMFVFPCTFFKSRACPPPPKSPQTPLHLFRKTSFPGGGKNFRTPLQLCCHYGLPLTKILATPLFFKNSTNFWHVLYSAVPVHPLLTSSLFILRQNFGWRGKMR